MTPLKAALKLAAAGVLALSLAGCISLLPKSKPAQLYRFGGPVATAKGPPGAGAVGVFSGGGEFQEEAGGDRILTVTGDHAAYIADARWAAPAQVLFNQAVASAFETSGGHVRLVPRGAPAPTDYVLRLDVRTFEARYDGEGGGAPTVVVRVHAALTRERGRTLVSEQLFESRIRAGDNRVSAIVAAFDHAVGDVLAQLVAWTDSTAR
jgi:cholesterol transport system auxiliary component